MKFKKGAMSIIPMLFFGFILLVFLLTIMIVLNKSIKNNSTKNIDNLVSQIEYNDEI